MPNIIPQAHFQFLRDQSSLDAAKGNLSRQSNQDAFKKMALTNQFNQAYQQYEQDKDAVAFEHRVRSIGTLYGNNKMANFSAAQSGLKPLYEYDEATGKTRKIGDLPSNATVKTKPKEGVNIQELKYYDAKKDKEIKRKEKERTNRNKTEMIRGGAQDTIDTIKEIKDKIKYFGAMGEIMPPLPTEYDKKEWLANVEKLKSRLVLNVMSEMKNASRTGATGFGQLSEKEMKVLQDASTALKKGMNERDALKYLNIIEEKANKILSTQDIPEKEQGEVWEDANGNKALVDPKTGKVIREL